MEQDLIHLITLQIPEAKPIEQGFLDVVGHTTRENTINNVYRYFLDPQQSPILSNLLMDSLYELIDERYKSKSQQKQLDLGDYQVHREYATGSGRIDLVLESKGDQSVIIIEVKVYHWLANDLHDYWQTFKYSDEKKAAIVLSLEPLKDWQVNEHFISITHAEWLNRSVQKGIPFELPIKEVLYFKDFVSNMNRLTHSKEMTEGVEFYLTHAEKITKAVQVRDEAFEFIIQQFQTVAANLNVELYGNERSFRHIWDKANQATAYYAVLPEEAIDGQGCVRVVLEVYSKAIPFKNEIWELIKDELKSHQLDKLTEGNAHYQHIAGKTYRFSPKGYSQLAERITEGIQQDLEPVRQKIMEFLKTKGAERNA